LRLYLEPSVLVKLFKKEDQSAKVIQIVEVIDKNREWFGCTSRWSLLEVARALKKDGKPKELIDLDLRELARHRINLIDLTRGILAESTRILAEHNIYTSDALHAATYDSANKNRRLDAMLSDDRHFQRLRAVLNVVTTNEVSID
jgi:predicted nucleic acid-binding protein